MGMDGGFENVIYIDFYIGKYRYRLSKDEKRPKMPTTPEPLVFGRVYPRRYLENDGQSKLLLLGKQSDQDIRQ